MRLLALAILLGFAAVNSACSSLSLNLSSAEVPSPELPQQNGSYEMSLHYDEATRYEFTADASRRPPNLNDPSTDLSRISAGRGAYAFTPWFELGLKLFQGAPLVDGAALQGRIALLGAATGLGWKASALVSTAGHSGQASGDQDGQFGNGGHKWKARASGRTTSLGFSVGYRWSDHLMAFAGAAQADHSLSGRIEHERSDNGLSPATNYDLSEVSGRSRTAQIGLRFGRSVQGALDLRAVERDWPTMGRGNARGKTSETLIGLGVVFKGDPGK